MCQNRERIVEYEQLMSHCSSFVFLPDVRNRRGDSSCCRPLCKLAEISISEQSFISPCNLHIISSCWKRRSFTDNEITFESKGRDPIKAFEALSSCFKSKGSLFTETLRANEMDANAVLIKPIQKWFCVSCRTTKTVNGMCFDCERDELFLIPLGFRVCHLHLQPQSKHTAGRQVAVPDENSCIIFCLFEKDVFTI